MLTPRVDRALPLVCGCHFPIVGPDERFPPRAIGLLIGNLSRLYDFPTTTH
jgi:hypothetical protein